MHKSLNLIALLCFAVCAKAGLLETHVVQEPVIAKVGTVVHSSPSAVSHQSITRYHNKAVVEPVVAPIVKTTVHTAPTLVKTVETSVPVVKTIHTAPAPVLHTYAAPAVVKTVTAPVVHTYTAPALLKTVSAPVVHTYNAPVVHALPVVHAAPATYTIHQH